MTTKLNETWIIRHKVTHELLVVPSGKSSWRAKGHAKNAWNTFAAYHAERLGVDLVPQGVGHWRPEALVFPNFDQQDVYELVKLEHKTETILAEAVKLLSMCLGRVDNNVERDIKTFLEGLNN